MRGSMDFGTPPRGTRADTAATAAAFASPSSPTPQRPEAATPSSLAARPLRGASSPSSPFSPVGAHLTAARHGAQRQGRLSPTPASSNPSRISSDRYVTASTRQGTSLAHFLLTSRERHTPMAIRAAQQMHAMRSPSRDLSTSLLSASSPLDDAAYGSPGRYGTPRSASRGGGGGGGVGTAASPRRLQSLSRAGSLAHTPRGGSAQLSGILAKMHLDPTSALRSSHERSGSSPSLPRRDGLDYGDDDVMERGGSPPPCGMELEPYTSKLARTLFADVAQTTVLPVNDTTVRPSLQPPRSPSGRRPPQRVFSFGGEDKDDDDDDEESRVRDDAGVSAALHGPQTRGGGGGADENDDDDADEAWRHPQHHHNGYTGRRHSVASMAEEDEAENARRLSASPLQGGRVPLATSDVNLFGVAERTRFDTSLGVVFECNRTRNFTTPSFRVIPHTPERILDAADMEDDFYMNLIDWSATSDVLSVALQNCVYLWNAKTCGITELPRIVSTGHGSRHQDGRSANAQLVCGLNWAPDGCHLAVGRNTGVVEVWDVETQQLVHTYRQHTDRTVSLAWEPQGGWLLASGSRDSTIVLRDVRERNTSDVTSSSSATAAVTTVLRGHATEVCGLKWSPTGAMLASGGNDNQLLLWDRRTLTTGSGGRGTVSGGEGSLSRSGTAATGGGAGGVVRRGTCQPLFYLNQHTAAVKALSWNPSQPALLASGGGSHDKTLRFWNATTGECMHHITTGSQICGVVWNRTGTELVTAHGYTDNQLSIWRYPSLRRIANLIGHTSRVLHLALSADGQTVVSAAGDETLRFWRCFPASELCESSPQLYRTGYSAGSPGVSGGGGGAVGLPGGASPRGASTPGPSGRTRARPSARCGSLSQDRDNFSFMNEEVELR